MLRFLPLVAELSRMGHVASSASAARYVVVLDEGVNPDAVAAYHEGFAGAEVVHGTAMRSTATPRTLSLAALAVDKEPISVSTSSRSDRVFRTTAQSLPTGINRIDGELSSTASGNGSGSVNINVAVVDTGIDPSHPDLNVVGGEGCALGIGNTDLQRSRLACRRDDRRQGRRQRRRRRHARTRTSPGQGAHRPGVGLTSTEVICGIDWVTAPGPLDPNNNIAVANMSLGGGGTDDGNCGNSNSDASTRRSAALRTRASRSSSPQGTTASTSARRPRPTTRSSRSPRSPTSTAPGGGAPDLPQRRDDTYATSATSPSSPPIRATRSRPGRLHHSTWMISGYNTSRARAWLAARRGRGCALHPERRLHRYPGADHLEAPGPRKKYT